MQKLQKYFWFTGGLLLGLTALSITRAASPPKGQMTQVTNDTLLYEKLSEIKGVSKQPKLDVDEDIRRLSQMENSFHEKLPPIPKK